MEPCWWLKLLATLCLLHSSSCYSVLKLLPENSDVPLREHPTWCYATLLYNMDFVPGVRTLGASLSSTRTPHKKVALVTRHVTESTVHLLREEGWTTKFIREIDNPNDHHLLYQSRLDRVYSKLHIYNITECDKVVYLDADILVRQNVDELFHCPGYCAVVRNAFFNTGVIVLKPSQQFFHTVVNHARSLPSYNGGEQGLLNSYLPDFDRLCPMFHNDPRTINSLRGQRCARLPAYYNGDIGPYYLHNTEWPIPELDEPKIIHYTLGSMKPWQWWSYPVFDVNWFWYDVYSSLPAPYENNFLMLQLKFIVPVVIFCILMAVCFAPFQSRPGAQFAQRVSDYFQERRRSTTIQNQGFQVMLANTMVGGLSFILAHCIAFDMSSSLPVMHPFYGHTLYFLWFYNVNIAVFGVWLCFWYHYGAITGRSLSVVAKQETSQGPVIARQRTFVYLTSTMLYSIVVFSYLCKLWNYDPTTKMRNAIALAALAVIFVFISWQQLPRIWYLEGIETRGDTTRSVSRKIPT